MTFLWILFAMIVIGNSSVLIHTQVVKKNKKSRMSFFIMHLALAGEYVTHMFHMFMTI